MHSQPQPKTHDTTPRRQTLQLDVEVLEDRIAPSTWGTFWVGEPPANSFMLSIEPEHS